MSLLMIPKGQLFLAGASALRRLQQFSTVHPLTASNFLLVGELFS